VSRRFTEAEIVEVWDRREAGELIRSIARRLGRKGSSIRRLFEDAGGVRPAPRRRAEQHLSLLEREEISRGVVAGETLVEPTAPFDESERANRERSTGLASPPRRHRIWVCVAEPGQPALPTRGACRDTIHRLADGSWPASPTPCWGKRPSCSSSQTARRSCGGGSTGVVFDDTTKWGARPGSCRKNTTPRRSCTRPHREHPPRRAAPDLSFLL